MHIKHNKHSKGFTLIELLVVIAIIGVLMAFLTVTYSAVRQRSRDAQRKSDLRQIQSALELYRADNDSYPSSTPTSPFASCAGQFLGTGSTPPVYMSKIPCDPQAANSPYKYIQTSAATYSLTSCIENTGDQDSNIVSSETPVNGLTCATKKYYVLTNP